MWGFIQDAVKTHLAPVTQDLWESVIFWRSIALVLLVLLMAAYVSRNKLAQFLLRPKRRNHDTDIFRRSDAIMSETYLSSCLTSLSNSHQYRGADRNRLNNFLQFFAQAGNRYLDLRISRSLRPLLRAVSELSTFTAHHFFSHPNPGLDVFCLHPEHRGVLVGGQGDDFYYRHAAELEKKIKSVEDRYEQYRSVVKKHLLK
jgi:hypothetical protein